MKMKIEAWEAATVAQTHAGKHGTVHICTDDLICGEAAERQREKVSRLAHGALYRQAVRELKDKQKKST